MGTSSGTVTITQPCRNVLSSQEPQLCRFTHTTRTRMSHDKGSIPALASAPPGWEPGQGVFGECPARNVGPEGGSPASSRRSRGGASRVGYTWMAAPPPAPSSLAGGQTASPSPRSESFPLDGWPQGFGRRDCLTEDGFSRDRWGQLGQEWSASLAGLPPAPCSAAQFLTVHDLGVGAPLKTHRATTPPSRVELCPWSHSGDRSVGGTPRTLPARPTLPPDRRGAL